MTQRARSMPETLRHAECDLRRAAVDLEVQVGSYAASRIRASYENVASVTSRCKPLALGSAYDVGCGVAYESFGLAATFDYVLAVDTSRRAIWRARRLMRATQVARIDFERVDAGQSSPGRRFDFVFSNVMSHGAHSRSALLHTLVSTLESDGWLFYAEVCEGYAPMELDQAIHRRDAREAFERLRQIVNGVLGRRRFRFYLDGTGPPLLESLGLEIARHQTQRWNGLATLSQLWCRAAAGLPKKPPGDGDYIATPPALAELRTRAVDLVEEQRGGGINAASKQEAEAWAAESSNHLAPFLLYVLMADLALPSLRPAANPLERIRWRAPRAVQPGDPDWKELEDLQARFLDLVAAGQGPDRGSDDD